MRGARRSLQLGLQVLRVMRLLRVFKLFRRGKQAYLLRLLLLTMKESASGEERKEG